jgi:hypothetical protein
MYLLKYTVEKEKRQSYIEKKHSITAQFQQIAEIVPIKMLRIIYASVS